MEAYRRTDHIAEYFLSIVFTTNWHSQGLLKNFRSLHWEGDLGGMILSRLETKE